MDPEMKRNVFLKWKTSLVFDGSKQKSCEDTFSSTPSLPTKTVTELSTTF